MRIKSVIFFFFFMIMFAFPATAETQPKLATGKIDIKAAWARASVSKNGAAYLTIYNHGNRAHLLTGAKTPVAQKVEIHTHTMDGQIMRMRKIDSIGIAPNKTIKMAPGGIHLMLLNLERKLQKGEEFPLVIKFESIDPINIKVKVEGIGAMHGSSGEKRDTSGHKHMNH